jgi:signal transduction histidine kinase
MSPDGGATAQTRRAVDLGLSAIGMVLAAVTSLAVTLPVVPAIVNERLDVAIITAATLVSVAVAALNWARGRVAGDGAALFRGAAFAVLAVLNGLILLVQVAGVDAAFGMSLEDPGQLPLIAAVLGRGTAAALLVGAGIVALRVTPSVAMRPSLLLIVPAATVALMIVLAARIQELLPMLVDPSTLAEMARHPAAALPTGSAWSLVAAQLLVGFGFAAAAVLAHRSWRRNGRVGEALLAAGLLIAAFSQVSSAIHPGSYTSVVTTGDLMRLAFYVVLLFGFVFDSRDDLRALQAANIELRRLGDAELASVALEERARLAREIHDGLAQDLWFAKLKHSRLAQLAGFAPEAQMLSDEVEGAIDNALAEARHAVAAMRQVSETGPLLDMLARHVDDFADRFALRAELAIHGPPPEIGARAQAELLRIVQEAMTNVRKHADATVVRVDVTSDEELRLTVTDNGHGFQPENISSGFGLESMRQRAAIIGARLTVTSEPQNGTRVELAMPIRGREGTNGS